MSQATQPADTSGTTEVLTLEQAADKFVGKKSGGNNIGAYRNGVDHFIQWCESHGMNTTADLTPARIDGYSVWMDKRVENGHWMPRTAKNYQGHAREYVEYCEQIASTPRFAHERIPRRTLTYQERRADLAITPERLDGVLNWYRANRPYSRDTVILWILRDTGMRAGVGLRGVDVGDVRTEDGQPIIHLVHRPEDKRGSDQDDGMKKPQHQRKVPIREELFDEIQRYIEEKREPCEEPSDSENHVEGGTRRPLLTTTYHGDARRASDTSIQTTVYMATCPNQTGVTADVGHCGCDGPPTTKTASACEHSVSPHKIRGTVVTRLKDAGHDYEDMTDYLGATAEVLRRTYDRADEDRRRERSEPLLDAL